jgi:tetratricopeptide (TPR) repeat protein
MYDARVSLGTVVVACALAAPVAARQDQHQHQHAAPEKLGTVSFPTSCAPAVQAEFARAVALLHSFWYDEAEKAFRAVAAADPSCAMAHWGVAMSLYHPIWAPPSPEELARGRAAVEQARALGPKTEREAAYVAAVEAFFRDSGTKDHAARRAAYQKAMEALHAGHPGDDEAAIFYALALLDPTPARDKTYANQYKAGEILNRVLPRHPKHPGVAHYLIHAFDYPKVAEMALAAARSYAKIAESSPHALHMPSHIFVRLGLWDDSIRSNTDSAETARVHVRKAMPDGSSFDELHALDYLAYAYLQQGRDAEAQAALDRIRAVTKLDQQQFAAAYALAAVPARVALERRRWAEAAAVAVAPGWFPWARFPYAEAITHFARAVGAARNGDLAAAREAAGRLDAIHQALVDSKTPYWPDQVEIQRRAAAAWIARAERRDDEALSLMRAAADLEDSTDKHPVTPGAVLPARELLGDLLAELGRHAEAAAEYEAALTSAPNRLYALLGAATSAQAAGDRARATAHYAKVKELVGTRDVRRPELARLEAMLTVK